MIPLSDNHLSLDNQIDAAVTYLNHAPEMVTARTQFKQAFPEYDRLVWQDGGSWIDSEASQVDPEFMSWVADWIEANTPIFWEEGEPWLPEVNDDGTTDCGPCDSGEHATIDDGICSCCNQEVDEPRPDLAGNRFDHVEQGGA